MADSGETRRCIEEYRRQLESLPWWAWSRRRTLNGALRYHLLTLALLGGSGK